MARYTLSKAERLSSLKAISQLFESGTSLTSNPLRIVWLRMPEPNPNLPPLQVMFSVSKKKFSRAVDRNRIKRLLRENYRLAKPRIYDQLSTGDQYRMAILFIGNEIPDFAAIQKSLDAALDRWLRKIKTPVPNSKA